MLSLTEWFSERLTSLYNYAALRHQSHLHQSQCSEITHVISIQSLDSSAVYCASLITLSVPLRETENFWSQSCITKLVFTFLRDIKATLFFLLWETAISVSLSLTRCCFLILSRLFSSITFISVFFLSRALNCFSDVLIAAWWETSKIFSSLRPELLLFLTKSSQNITFYPPLLHFLVT